MVSKKRRSALVALAVLIATSALLVAWVLLRRQSVVVQPIVRGVVIDAVYATGAVEPEERVLVKSRIAGTVAEVSVREGQRVKKGDLLARVDSPGRKHALDRGRIQLGSATTLAGPSSPQLAALDAQTRALDAEIALARIELSRIETLVANGSAAPAELDRQRAVRDRLDAQRAALIAQRKGLALDLTTNRAQLAESVASLASDADETAVRSPLDGVLLTRRADPGEVVAPNQILFEVADLSALHVELHVDESDIARVREGAKASHVAITFYAFEDRVFDGTVQEILPEPDRARRAYVVKVRLASPPADMRNGMTVEANIIVERRDDVLLAPLTAVDNGRIWIVENDRAVQRSVVVGLRDLATIEIVSGVREGELAILGAARAKLEPGARVAPVVNRPAERSTASRAVSMAP